MGLINTQLIRDFYTHYAKNHGINVGWPSMEYAQQLYDVSSKHQDQLWETFQAVLDVGSGEGQFQEFLRKHRQFKGQYVGLELIEEFHQSALEKYGQDENAQFICDEFLNYNFGNQKFDWVFSLGSLSVKQDNLPERDLAFCQKMKELSRYGFSIYLNDLKFYQKGYLEEVENLAIHDIDDFLKMLAQNFSPITLQIDRMLPNAPQGVIIHMTWPTR